MGRRNRTRRTVRGVEADLKLLRPARCTSELIGCCPLPVCGCRTGCLVSRYARCWMQRRCTPVLQVLLLLVGARLASIYQAARVRGMNDRVVDSAVMSRTLHAALAAGSFAITAEVTPPL